MYISIVAVDVYQFLFLRCRYTFLEIYPWADKDPENTPLEFVWKPATHKLDYWFFGDVNTEELYAQVVPCFQHIHADVNKFTNPSKIV